MATYTIALRWYVVLNLHKFNQATHCTYLPLPQSPEKNEFPIIVVTCECLDPGDASHFATASVRHLVSYWWYPLAVLKQRW